MILHDITRGLSGDVVTYPGDLVPVVAGRDTGKFRISTLVLSSHSGTHIDAPSHYLPGGTTADNIPVHILIGPCRVLEVGAVGVIGRDDIEGRIAGTRRLLLKTWFSQALTFDPAYPALTAGAAEYLVEEGVTCVGTDAPSIEAFDGDGSVHRTLLGAGVPILELLDLSTVPGGDYLLIAAPIKVIDCDGAPARVFLGEPGGQEGWAWTF
jgi:arylformamidase